MEEVWVAAITAIGTIFTGFFATLPSLLKSRRQHAEKDLEIEQLRRELSTQSEALSFEDVFVENDQVRGNIERLCRTTEIDRVMLLRAWNGRHNPRWTTAIWQYRLGNQEEQEYIHTELDPDYIGRLRSIEDKGAMMVVTDEIPESLVKRIYKKDGVKSSLWDYIGKNCIEGGDQCVILYMSFATQEGVISEATATECDLITDRMKGAIFPSTTLAQRGLK